MEYADNQELSRTLAAMGNSPIKRIRRTRSRKTPAPFFDDDELPDWIDSGLREANKPVTTNASNEMGRIATSIAQRLYPLKDEMKWPQDFASQASKMRQDDSRNAFRVYYELMQALTTSLIGSLSDLQFKIMIVILNRTWKWKKPREGIPNSHFLRGVLVNGVVSQAPIAKSPDHLHEAYKRLNEQQMIRITSARCDHGPVNIYEINVEKVLTMAEKQNRMVRKSK